MAESEHMTFLVAQLGSRMDYAIPRMLHEAGMLDHFYTDICAIKGWPRFLCLIPKPLRPISVRRLLGRVPHGVPPDRITAFTVFGLKYAWRRTAARSSSEITVAFLWVSKTFCDLVLQRGLGSATGVYTFNGAGLELLQAARARGFRTIMEQTIAPYKVERQLLREEHEAHPGWQLPLPNDELAEEFFAREVAEWEEANLILCPSEFVRDGIATCAGPVERCTVVPYGLDASFSLPQRLPPNGSLRVLTVGEVGLRKGTPYVLKAAENLRDKIKFRMVGPVGVLPKAEVELRALIELTGPIPHAEVLPQYAWADVFLLPSLCEGSARVVYEALAAGLPVICTPNTGSVVRDGVDGFIVPIRDSSAIAEKLERLATQPNIYWEMSRNARQRAGEFTLQSYRQRLLAVLTSGFSQ